MNDVPDEAAAHAQLTCTGPGEVLGRDHALLLGREIGMRHDRYGGDLVPVFVVRSPRWRWRFHEAGVRHPAQREVAEVPTLGTPGAHVPPAWHPDESVREHKAVGTGRVVHRSVDELQADSLPYRLHDRRKRLRRHDRQIAPCVLKQRVAGRHGL
ncbi:MAG: hypothetical protein MZU91_12710 [Desulfosudis oleivorans]|nr:hypothetical protein [Desulfosudis oleivorans]